MGRFAFFRKFSLSLDLLSKTLEYLTPIIYVMEFNFSLGRKAQCALHIPGRIHSVSFIWYFPHLSIIWKKVVPPHIIIWSDDCWAFDYLQMFLYEHHNFKKSNSFMFFLNHLWTAFLTVYKSSVPVTTFSQILSVLSSFLAIRSTSVYLPV